YPVTRFVGFEQIEQIVCCANLNGELCHRIWMRNYSNTDLRHNGKTQRRQIILNSAPAAFVRPLP
ncbi:MAG: hypothetical protein KME42_17105, partial [Tildeniella nuda ZEHNDER 1965/U140]|nr:hypothetical protein [Tildeniella nuda ZEHNDER 1965/U140]